jgi:hypothetical protein
MHEPETPRFIALVALAMAFATDCNKRCMFSSYGRPSSSRYRHNEGRPAVCAAAVLQF